MKLVTANITLGGLGSYHTHRHMGGKIQDQTKVCLDIHGICPTNRQISEFLIQLHVSFEVHI
jgi:hypothetical protein